MEDAEYPTYLKRQTYKDLPSMSCSIDQENQPARCAMVMAELDRKDAA